MSSKLIYPHVPYFYIIVHISTGKRYVGCRYAKGCHPSEFMTEDGYQTSSRVVHQIIKDEGLDAFKVISIKTQDEVGDVHDYETKFLIENDCAASSEWLNLNNNTSITPYGTDAFRNAMTNIYGVDHHSKTEEAKERMRKFKLAETETKITNEILQGNFNRFEYLWDTVDEVFLMGVLKSLNADIQDRYVTIGSRNAKRYIDTKTKSVYYINPSRFSTPLPDNLVPYRIGKKR